MKNKRDYNNLDNHLDTSGTENFTDLPKGTAKQLLKYKTCKGHITDVVDKDNEELLSGYRIGYKTIGEVASTFCKCHNETANIWTHFIGALITCTAAILFIVYVRDTSHIGYDGLRMFDEFHLKEPGLDMT